MVLIIAGCKASVRALPMAKSAGLWKNDMNIPLQRIDFTVIDSEGYRPNVGIILCNTEGQLFWAKRIGQHSWQFPQGGIRWDESPEQAMFRELAEEIGLGPSHVQVIGSTRGWLRYRLPRRLIRPCCSDRPACIGQKQVWFLLRMMSGEEAVQLDSSERPEFDHWQWVDYWYPLRAVVPFKRHVYWRALRELAPLVRPGRPPVDTAALLRHPVEEESGLRHEPDRTAVSKPLTILPLRPAAVGRNPVITHRVVAARRAAPDSAPVGLSPVTVVSCEEIRSPFPAAPDSRHAARR
jgi:putative (di)nucleoside polyphosphate hydrolase